MLRTKSMMFTGEVGSYAYGHAIANDASSKLTRWLSWHKDIAIREIKPINESTIFIAYDEDDLDVGSEKPNFLEDGWYFISPLGGKFIRMLDYVDVSYMISDYDRLYKAFIECGKYFHHAKLPETFEILSGKIQIHYDTSYEMPRSDGGPITITKHQLQEIPLYDMIYNEYLPAAFCGSWIDNISRFHFKDHPGAIYRYYFNDMILFSEDGNIDLTHTVEWGQMRYIVKLDRQIPFPEDGYLCYQDGKFFLKEEPDAHEHKYEFEASRIIKQKYL